jgi:hypothetical protein
MLNWIIFAIDVMIKLNGKCNIINIKKLPNPLNVVNAAKETYLKVTDAPAIHALLNFKSVVNACKKLTNMKILSIIIC